MPRASRARILYVAALALALASCNAPPTEADRERSPDDVRVVDGRLLMGTVLDIELRGVDDGRARPLLDALFARVDALDRSLTRFDPASELSRLNARAGSGPQPIVPDLARILADAQAYGTLTRGTFDVTVGPLVALWTEAGRTGRLPDPDALARVRARVGARRVLRVGRETATLAAGAELDLGGIAKGFALDELRKLLERAGVERALVSFGQSSLLALGAAPGEDGWRVLLRDAGDGFAGVLALRDQSLSVSSSLGAESVIDGRRYGHVLDPRSGWPLSEPRLAAVVADSGARAEALSKALLVLEPNEGIALLDALPDAEGILLEPGAPPRMSRGFARATGFEPPPARR